MSPIKFLILIFLLPSTFALLKCNFTKKNSFKIFDSIYVCDAVKSSIEHFWMPRLSRVVGDHAQNFNNSDVRGFFMSNVPMFVFPFSITEIFPNIEMIRFVKIKLQKVKPEHLKQFGDRLKFLSLANNEIEYLERDLFDYSSNLRLIDVRGNNLSHIDPRALSHFDNLEFLYLSSNKCNLSDAEGHDEVENLIEEVEEKICFDKFAEMFLDAEKKLRNYQKFATTEIEDLYRGISYHRNNSKNHSEIAESYLLELIELKENFTQLEIQNQHLTDDGASLKNISKHHREEVERMREKIKEMSGSRVINWLVGVIVILMAVVGVLCGYFYKNEKRKFEGGPRLVEMRGSVVGFEVGDDQLLVE